MSTVTTTRPVDLEQLADELGTGALSMSDGGTERTVTCHDVTITRATLQAAVDAHVAIDIEGNRRTIQDRLASDLTALDATKTTLDAIIAKANAQIGPADTKDIARALRDVLQAEKRIIRMALGAFNATD